MDRLAWSYSGDVAAVGQDSHRTDSEHPFEEAVADGAGNYCHSEVYVLAVEPTEGVLPRNRRVDPWSASMLKILGRYILWDHLDG